MKIRSSGADHAFQAMRKHMRNLNGENALWTLTIDDHRFTQLGITNNDRLSIYKLLDR
ncbi:hypothetical protein [Candidatus Phyllobacterium onerii]|jgi:hypothetical protein|uniref:hypothetical protein n=1 Tax=Candidatus Phyllobacterium onerii TaxID=3020828 RepID=UPI0023304879|nr:hypothetical protein [Phyllobacterium sp. IY22]